MKLTYRFSLGLFALMIAGITLARAGSAQSVSPGEFACGTETHQASITPVSTGSSPLTQLISPDGKRIAVVRQVHGHLAIFVMDRNGVHVRDLTGAFSNNLAPAWSPDSQWIAFVSDRNGLKDLYIERIDGAAIRRLTRHAGNNIQPYWTPNGKQLVFLSDREGSFARWTMGVDGGNQRPLPATETAGTTLSWERSH